MPARHQRVETKDRRALPSVIVSAVVGLVAFGVLGWIAPAQAYTKTSYPAGANDISLIKDGNNDLYSAGVDSNSIGRVIKYNTTDGSITFNWAMTIKPTVILDYTASSVLIAGESSYGVYKLQEISKTNGTTVREYTFNTGGPRTIAAATDGSRIWIGLKNFTGLYRLTPSGSTFSVAEGPIAVYPSYLTHKSSYEGYSDILLVGSGTNIETRNAGSLSTVHKTCTLMFPSGGFISDSGYFDSGLNRFIAAYGLNSGAIHTYYQVAFNPITCAKVIHSDPELQTLPEVRIGVGQLSSAQSIWGLDARPITVDNGAFKSIDWTETTSSDSLIDTYHATGVGNDLASSVVHIPSKSQIWLGVSSTLFRFQYSDEAALTITSGPTATGINQNSANIGWTTNLNSDSKVLYGTTTSYGTVVYSSIQTATHAVPLSGLSAGTTYNYKVVSCTTFTCVESANNTFTTAALVPPTVEITNPVDGSTIFNDSIVVTGTTSNGSGTVVEVKYRVCAGESTSCSGIWLSTSGIATWTALAPSPLADAINTVEVRATDNSTPAQVVYHHHHVTVDANAPTPVINHPIETPKQVYSVATGIALDGTASDVGAGTVTAMHYRVDGAATWNAITITSGNPINFSTTISIPAVNGDHTIQVRATDNQNNYGYDSVVVEFRAPDFSFTITPATQTKNQGENATYNFTVTALNGWNTAVTVTITNRDNFPSNRIAINPSTPPTCAVGSFPCSGTIVLTTNDVNPALSPFNMVASATGGSITHTAPFELILNPGPDWRFQTATGLVNKNQGDTTPAVYSLDLRPQPDGTTYPNQVALTYQITGGGASNQRCVGADPCMFNAASFSASPVSVPSTPTFSITPKAMIPTGDWVITVTGTGNDAMTRTHDYIGTLRIANGPDFIFNPASNATPVSINQGASAVFNAANNNLVHVQSQVPSAPYTWDIALTAGTITPPSGGQISMITGVTPNPTTVNCGGTSNSALTITTASNITPGIWTVQIVGTGASDPFTPHRTHNYTAQFTVLAPDYTFTLKTPTPPSPPAHLDIVQGQTGTATLNIMKTAAGYPYNVNYSMTGTAGLVAGRFTWTPAPVQAPGNLPIGLDLVLSVNTAGGVGGDANPVPSGEYTVTATAHREGAPGTDVKTLSFVVHVTNGPDWKFDPPPDPLTDSARPGDSVNYVLSLKEDVPTYNYSVALTLDSVAPAAGVGKLTLAPAMADVTITPAAQQRTATINVADDTPFGTYTLTFKGYGADNPLHRTHFISVTLEVSDPDFFPRAANMSFTRPTGQGMVTTELLLEDRPNDNTVIDYTWDIASVTLDTVTPSPNPGEINATVVPIEPPGVYRTHVIWQEPAGYITLNWGADVPAGEYTLVFKAIGSDPAPVKVHEFTITLALTNSPPVISNINCTAGTDRITVTWTTNTAANGTLYYGTALPPSSSQAEGAGDVTDHSVTATGLESGTDYRYQVESVNSAGTSGRQPATAGTCTTTTAVDLEDPVVEWRNPLNTDTVTGTIPLRAYAHDNVAVNKVDIRIDGNLIHTDGAPAQWPAVDEWGTPTWDSTTVSNGGHSLNATATDSSSRTASHVIDITVNNASAAPVCSAFRYQVNGQNISIWWTTDISSNSVVYYCREGSAPGTCGNCPLPPGAPAGSGYCTKYTGSGDSTDHYVHLTDLVVGRYHFMAESCKDGSCGQCRKD